ncbi:hypothetical protein NDU88_005830 [Pleurodeles waltl]|uniref:Uncharacterized protein n=1 Tax=Pleurodeles waltl TaxID=8319 RepID=A0AAV7SMT8_PLEWA|nr:hypothetical protein NDU88_005830 [Pleurodeles waltl]
MGQGADPITRPWSARHKPMPQGMAEGPCKLRGATEAVEEKVNVEEHPSPTKSHPKSERAAPFPAVASSTETV